MRSPNRINNAFISIMSRSPRCTEVVFAEESGPFIGEDMRLESSGMLAYLLTGSQKIGFYRGGKITTRIMRPGEVFFAPVGHPYTIDWQQDCQRIGVVAGEFGRLSISWNDHDEKESRTVQKGDLWYSAGIREETDLFALFAALTGRIAKPGDSPVSRALAELIVQRIIEHLETEWKVVPNGSGIQTFQRIATYLEAHSKAPVSRKELAMRFHLHPDYVTRLFQQHAQCGFSEYLLRLRMLSATWLLDNSELSVREIAANCGFNDVGYFIKVFRGRYGKTPAKYRSPRSLKIPILSTDGERR
ncbi:MAG: AraC family transcriptional regulator [Victivallales bacterium]|nr:AraC family transcriptional regulator [Victivallales bacterium]